MAKIETVPGKLKPHQIVFTNRAVQKTYELMVERNNFNLKLRLFIVGGGCAGFQYGFAFDETVHSDDVVIKRKVESQEQEVYLIIDPISFLYLSEAKIDYLDDPHNARFVVYNPGVSTACRCPRLQVAEE
jgi:iron-sulfur cluster insertion protein